MRWLVMCALLSQPVGCYIRDYCAQWDPGCSPEASWLYLSSLVGAASATCQATGTVLTAHGNSSTTSSIYSLASGTYTAGPALPQSIGAGGSAVSLSATALRACESFVVAGDNGTATFYYNAAANSFSTGPTLSGPAGAGAQILEFTAASGDARYLIVHGSGTSASSVFDPVAGTVSAGPAMSGVINNGANHVRIENGLNPGKFLIFHGGATNGSSLFDPATQTAVAGPAVTGNTGAGSSSYYVSSGANSGNIFISGCNGGVANSMYQPATHTIVNPSLNFTSLCTTGGSSFAISSGIYAGEHMNLLGGTVANRYTDSANSIGNTGGPSCTTGAGSHNLLVTAGPATGRQLVVCAGNLTATTLFDPTAGTFGAGPALGAIAGVGAFSVALTQ